MQKQMFGGGGISIFIPTYHRPGKLRRCLESVVNEIDKCGFTDVYVEISSNDANDIETENVVNEFQRSYIRYHANTSNLGIDRNHDLLYQYCQTKYVLLLADDDILLGDTINIIHDNTKSHDFIFAICNQQFCRGDILDETRLLDGKGADQLTKIDALRRFTVNKPAPILPLIPYFGGIVIDIEKVNAHVTATDRKEFEGTFHQYIGSLWLALLYSNENVCIFNNVTIGQGFDDDKTWFDYKDEVFKNANRLYEILPLPEKIRRYIFILIKYSGRRIGRIVIPILKVNSRRWRL